MADAEPDDELDDEFEDIDDLKDEPPEPKPLSEYDTYQEFLENEMMEDELIVGPSEQTTTQILLKLGFYLVLIFIFLSVLALLGYVIIEVLTYLAEYASDNITVENTTTSAAILLTRFN